MAACHSAAGLTLDRYCKYAQRPQTRSAQAWLKPSSPDCPLRLAHPGGRKGAGFRNLGIRLRWWPFGYRLIGLRRRLRGGRRLRGIRRPGNRFRWRRRRLFPRCKPVDRHAPLRIERNAPSGTLVFPQLRSEQPFFRFVVRQLFCVGHGLSRLQRMAWHRKSRLQTDKPSGIAETGRNERGQGRGASRNVPDCVNNHDVGDRSGNGQGRARLPRQPAACASCAAARDDATISSFIVARVAPTNSLRAARASSVSKSTSVRITHGADWPLKR